MNNKGRYLYMKRKNNKGFTLIELLAVVVILIIVIFIALTKVRKSSKKAQLDAIKANAATYVKAVNEFAGVDNLTSDRMYSGTFGKIFLENYGVKINGTSPDIATVTMNDFEVESACMSFGRYKVTYENGKLSEPFKGKCPSGDILVFDYTGREQEFTAPIDGKYKIEVWGAEGGSSTYNSNSNSGGPGGYSSGVIELHQNDVLYLNVGGKGNSVTYSPSTGELVFDKSTGYNGGGYAAIYPNNSSHAGGGGATHVAFGSGLLSTLKGNNDSVVIAAGGGGGSSTHDAYPSYSADGGAGGGMTGGSGIPTNGTCYHFGNGGTQTSIGNTSNCPSSGRANRDENVPAAADFGKGSNYTANFNANGYAYGGGGAGLYGGQSGYHASGGGGSGFIGNSLLSDKVMYCKDCTKSSGTNTKTVITSCVSEKPIENCAKLGNGYIKITILEQKKSNTYNYAYTGDTSVFVAPKTGNYKLELWGAQGGVVTSATNIIPGYGSYSVGTIHLNADDRLFVTVGGVGLPGVGGVGGAGGYNGGGAGADGRSQSSSYPGAGGGGGATHIATVPGVLSSLEQYKGDLSSDSTYYVSSNIIMVAGGGGGVGAYYTSASGALSGGSGGGKSGVNGTIVDSSVTLEALAGTQISGFQFGKGGNGRTGTNDGSSSCEGTGGGGGGFFGGAAQTTAGARTDSSGAGGSGYIANSSLSDKSMYCYNCTSDEGTNTKTVSTTCVNSAPTANCAKQGSGFVKITFIN